MHPTLDPYKELHKMIVNEFEEQQRQNGMKLAEKKVLDYEKRLKANHPTWKESRLKRKVKEHFAFRF